LSRWLCRQTGPGLASTFYRGPSPRGRLGMFVVAGHALPKARPEYFMPLRLPVDFPWPEPDPDPQGGGA